MPKPKPNRVWEYKLKSSSYWTAICGGHVVTWTGKKAESIDAATGKLVAGVAAESKPWLDGDRVWLPTKKGFEVRTAKLALERTIVVPAPKGTTLHTRLARVYGSIAYRMVRSKAIENVGGSLRNTYSLLAFDITKNKQLFVAPIAKSSANTISGACGRDEFAAAFFSNGYEVFVGTTKDGRVGAAAPKRAQCGLDVVGGEVIDDQLGEVGVVGVLRGGTWKTLDCTGELTAIGKHLYAIGHRELVRLDGDLNVKARAPIATPEGDDVQRQPPTSACLDGKALVVIESRDALGVTPVATASYRVLRRDPLTLAAQPGEATLEDVFGLRLLGKVGDVFVAEAYKRVFALHL